MTAQRILIVGGGFAGAFSAKYLRRYARKDTEIELINSNNYFVFQPLLPEVVSGTINAPDAVTPLRQLLPKVSVRMATVTSIDKDARTVSLLQGSYRTPQVSHYDHLVLAVGQKTNLAVAPGFREHSLCIRDLADAHELRNKVIRRLEHADITKDRLIKKRLLTFVVAGGGFSGVETIGEIIEMIRRTLRFYPNISADEIRALLVQAGDRILPELPEKLGRYAEKMLAARNVEIVLDKRVASATANAVFLSDGARIESCLLVTTVGNGPRRITEQLDVALDRGKISVDSNLRVAGESNIWALGDAAAVPLGPAEENRFAPPTAQFAVQEARRLARNIAALQKNEPLTAFDYKPKGAMASIGNYKGVAEVFGFSFSGLLAWMTWRFLYIGMLPGFSTRLRVALNWLFDYMLPRSIVQIATTRGGGVATRCFVKGDVISQPGQRTDGFYTVLSGKLELRVAGQHGDEDFVRILEKGDHWGERLLEADHLAQGELTAMEDTRVMVLGASDFTQLRNAFPALKDYLSTINDSNYPPSLRRTGDGVDAD